MIKEALRDAGFVAFFCILRSFSEDAADYLL
jgi:hypothetical protein